MEPTHPRLDPLALLVQQLGTQADHPVVSYMDASENPSEQPISVIQIPNHAPHSLTTRWSFSVDITITTFARTSATAWSYHAPLADAILELTALDGGRVTVSTPHCTLEPVTVAGGSGPQWPGVVSNYTIYIREG